MKPELLQLCVKPNEPISHGLAILEKTLKGICIVVNDEGKIQGTLTDGDCRRALLAGLTLDSPLKDAAHTNFIAVDKSFPIEQVYALMRTNSVRQIPVVDDQRHLIDLILEKAAAASEQTAHVLILAGGKGTRLRPLTQSVPKPMLQIGGKPMLKRLVDSLVESGFSQISISTSYLAEQIESYFGNGERWGCSIEYIREDKELGTAGPLKLLSHGDNKPILVLNGDLVTQVNFSSLLEFHRQSKYDLTVGATTHRVDVPFGVLDLNPDGTLKAIAEKPILSFPVNAGIYVLESSLLSLIPQNEYFAMTDLMELALAKKYTIGAFPIHEEWLDVGVPEQYISALSKA